MFWESVHLFDQNKTAPKNLKHFVKLILPHIEIYTTHIARDMFTIVIEYIHKK